MEWMAVWSVVIAAVALKIFNMNRDKKKEGRRTVYWLNVFLAMMMTGLLFLIVFTRISYDLDQKKYEVEGNQLFRSYEYKGTTADSYVLHESGLFSGGIKEYSKTIYHLSPICYFSDEVYLAYPREYDDYSQTQEEIFASSGKKILIRPCFGMGVFLDLIAVFLIDMLFNLVLIGIYGVKKLGKNRGNIV